MLSNTNSAAINPLPGKTYQVLLQERPGRGFSEPDVTELLRLVLPQLAAFHQQGLSHGTISPATLLQDATGAPKLLAHPGFVVPGYAPAEQLPHAPATPASDVYALGVTMLVLLTHRSPEELHQPSGSWNWQEHCLVSDQLAAVLERAIAPLPDRFANAIQMQQALNVIPSGSTHFVAPPPVQDSVIPTQSSLPWKYGVIGAGTVILMGLASFGVLKLVSAKPDATAPIVVRSEVDPSVASQPSTGNLSTRNSSTETSASIVGSSSAANPSDAVKKSPDSVASQAKPPTQERSNNVSPPPAMPQLSTEPKSINTERVDFSAGSTGTTLIDQISPTQLRRYLLDCGSGQKMAVQVQQGDVRVRIVSPNGQELGMATTSWQEQLPNTGDYALEISSINGSSYTIRVDVF
jgi:serine/threonine-protein kinase